MLCFKKNKSRWFAVEMSKGGVGAEIILSAVMEGGGSGNRVSTSASQASSLPSKLVIVTND